MFPLFTSPSSLFSPSSPSPFVSCHPLSIKRLFVPPVKLLLCGHHRQTRQTAEHSSRLMIIVSFGERGVGGGGIAVVVNIKVLPFFLSLFNSLFVGRQCSAVQ